MYELTEIDDNTYEFSTKDGLVYRVVFSAAADRFHQSCTMRDRIQEVSLDLLNDSVGRYDSRISETVVTIVKERCRKCNCGVVYVCDDSEGKDRHRSIVFKRWNATYNKDDYQFKSTIVEGSDSIKLYSGIIVPNDEDATTFISQFDYTAEQVRGKI